MNDPQNPPADPPPRNRRTRTGKVARLPKAVRDKICQMMLDGRTYLQIIAQLGEDGKELNEDNLSTWKSGGYLEWRDEERELLEMRYHQEYANDLARETQGTSLCEATSKMLIAQLLDGLRFAGPASLASTLADKPEIYVRLLHAVSRLSAGAISCERQRLKEAEIRHLLEKENGHPADRAITEQTVSNVNELLRNH